MSAEAKKVSKTIQSKFKKLDGSHPLKKAVPKSFVPYKARIRKNGSVRYFNFELAKEMGFIDKTHPDQINSKLEKEIINTFGLIIINEFDEMNDRKYPAAEVKEGEYMATRYLQLQHADKTGKNSGDGRSIWNGQISHKGKSWDVSSCGTGATRLSPATSKFNKFFENGDPSISYGCGYSEIDEGYVTALFSEIFRANGLTTEKTLALIEYEKGYCVRVRAHECLLRPSHFFGYLKQNDLVSLTQMTDYFINYQIKQKVFPEFKSKKQAYEFFMNYVANTFSNITARFEDEYIFCWLDWDGDNILMDGGIIDYGSIRQFGIFHSEYRYDDDDRFSTNIIEQKDKARYIVQTFAQLIDYVRTGEKKSINDFKTAPILQVFDSNFEHQKNYNLLKKIGYGPSEIEFLLKNYENLVVEFRKEFSYFEKQKSVEGKIEVSDGVTWNAVFNMRDLLREYPQILLSRGEAITDEEFIDIIKSEFAVQEDLEINSYRKNKISQFQKRYQELINLVSENGKKTKEKILLSLIMRSSLINKSGRVTGDAITHIVELIMKKKKSLSGDDIYELIKTISNQQSSLEEHKHVSMSKHYESGLLKEIGQIIKDNRAGL